MIAESRPTDDVLDILGFLTFEMVQNLTVEALKIQRQELVTKRLKASVLSKNPQAPVGLFPDHPTPRKPIEPRHVQHALECLQSTQEATPRNA